MNIIEVCSIPLREISSINCNNFHVSAVGKLMELHGEGTTTTVKTGEDGTKVERVVDGFEPPVQESV